MFSLPDGVSAPVDLGSAETHGVGARSPDSTVSLPPISITSTRSDSAEVRQLRHRLLQLILENQHHRENERQRKLHARDAS
ncbi:MAG: hypothetical protein AAGF31_00155 [Planctomycetota bacterium]